MYTGYPVPSGNASFQNFTAKVESGKLGGAWAHGVSWNESGGGGKTGDNGEPRTGGAGGGAWGNGGDGYNISGGSGPGGNTFGKGGSTGTSYWAGSAAGAWCLRDFTSNTFESGVGIKTGSSLSIGTVELYYINNQITI